MTLTKAEQARLIEQQEFEAESKALLERALAYSKSIREAERANVNAITIPDTPHTKSYHNMYYCKKYEYKGETKSVRELAEKYGLTHQALRHRLKKCKTIEQALTGSFTISRPAKLYEFNGQSKSLQEWAEEYGLTYSALWQRMKKVKTLEQALAGGRGVASNFEEVKGTGAGTLAQDFQDITFQQNEDESK